MTPLNRALVGSLLILAWPTAHAADGQKVFTQGGANPAAMACLVTLSLVGQAHARYSCSTKADCNYDGCANRACSSSSSYCNNGVWDYGCVSTL